MTIFVDASAMIAMMTNEPEAADLIEALLEQDRRLTSPIAWWEAARGVARKHKMSIVAAATAVNKFLKDFDIIVVPVAAAEGRGAIDAHRRYGKGSTHPARLNMGDCFAYACAKSNGAKLLYKGNDFAQTDLR